MNKRQKKKLVHKFCIKHQDEFGLMSNIFLMGRPQIGHTFNSYESYLRYTNSK